MMGRPFVYIIFFCLQFLLFGRGVYAQDVELKFSYLEESPGATHTNPPYLKIDYVNRSNRDYYFPSLLSSENDMPSFVSLYLINAQKDSAYYDSIESRLYKDKAYKKGHYVVSLEYFQDMGQVAWTFDSMPNGDSGENLEKWDGDMLSYDMHSYNTSVRNDKSRIVRFFVKNGSKFPISIYWDVRYHIGRMTGKSPYYTSYWLRRPKRLMKSPSLVFLPTNSTVTQYASLQSIKGTGIILTFDLSSPCPPDKVHSDWRDFIKLPEKVCGYDLYAGSLEYKPITIDFSTETASSQ